jgi:hypothetical protein
MNKLRVIIGYICMKIVVIILSLLAVFLVGCSCATSTTITSPVDKGYLYLEHNLNPELYLLRESPDTGSPQDKTYWLATDNVLASYALKTFDPELSKNLMLSIDKYGYQHDHYIEILFGITNIEPVYAVDGYKTISKTDGYQIITDNLTGHRMDDYQQYFDKLCYEILWEAYTGNRTGAESNYNLALAIWDKKGFVDKATPPNNYDTYKLALFYYTSRILGKLDTLPFKETLLNTINSLRASNGGFQTSYYYDNKEELQSQSSTNTETTSLVLIALYFNPEPLP